MDFFATSAAAPRQRTNCAIVGIYKAKTQSADALAANKTARGLIAAALSSGDMDGTLGKTLLISRTTGISAKRILLVGLGKRSEFGGRQYRAACRAAVTALSQSGARDAISYLSREKVKGHDAYSLVRIGAAAAHDGLYRFDEMKTKTPPKPKLRRLGFAVKDDEQLESANTACADAGAINAGVDLARTLGNRPPNVCTPTHLADQAREMGRQFKSISTRIVGRSEMTKLGMGAFLSVTAGATAEPKLIVINYRGAGSKDPKIALVGKGITFDSGGISLKPPPQMDEMKFDMCGAASVLGTMRSVAELELPLNVIGVIPACENMPSGNATHPGDIVTTMSGKTVEVLNTDAEGRLILCDALTYTRQFEPETVIDIATLTGACVIALGGHYTGLMSPDNELANELLASSEQADDLAWRLPLSEDYAEQLKSNFADFANVGGKAGGAITAGCFLQKFTAGLSWAHLDIAGSAWRGGDQKGATGRPVGMLTQFLINRARETA